LSDLVQEGEEDLPEDGLPGLLGQQAAVGRDRREQRLAGGLPETFSFSMCIRQ